ncbi:U1 small nuclear ribonucleoprotein 70 kDa-like isoform X2 [Musa acuminata AAA Group]|uniref:U1 small nuclear ribonucleoprotein 70 kDa-like isoform X2 n=1 Tax=Musa acuminata AAA Group TaxID=214697 RepID=UPI0031D3D0B3
MPSIATTPPSRPAPKPRIMSQCPPAQTSAYKQADGRKIDNKRVLVHVEQGRSVPNWRPQRLGGGLGTTRTGGEEVNQKHSGREQQQCASGHSRSEESRAEDDRQVDSLEKGDGIESENGRGPVNVPMIGHGSEGMTDSTTIGTEIETEKGIERGNECGRERERERGRDRGHGRDKERERGRDTDREHDSQPERDQVHERDYDQAGYERDHGYSHDKEAGYGSESKHGRGSCIKSSS